MNRTLVPASPSSAFIRAVLVFVGLLSALAMIAAALFVGGQQTGAAGYSWGIFWTASQPWTGGNVDPLDSEGDAWFEVDYDNSAYSFITLPDVNSIPDAGTD